MKKVSVIVPIYNVEKYIKRCLDSLIVSEIMDDIEILVVNDGGKDHSVEIIQKYVDSYPETVRLIDKENGGHGSTINAGIKEAKGKYFRVLDSDDWFNSTDFVKFVNRLKSEDADLVVCDYRKEHTYNSKSEYFVYKNLEDRKCYCFDDIDLKILEGEYFVMATSTYKTEILRTSGLKMLEKTFYVDMQYNVVPMTKVETFTYYHLDIYRYFIGRDDQSVNEKVMIKRIDQQIRVNKLMADAFHNCQFDSKHLKKYMLSYLDIITTVSSIMLVRAGTQEALDKKKEMLEYIREQDLWLYHKLRYSILGRAANLPGRGGRKMFVAAYKVCQKFYGFN